MDERVRRRRPSRDREEGNPRNLWSGNEHYSSYDVGHNLKFSSSRVDNILIPNDRAFAGERMYKAGLPEPEHGLNKNYYRSTSPGFDGWARKKHDELHDGPIHSYRSRSRSRDRGRSRSRSQSWGRGRDRRSRSRSRNRSRNLPRDQTRSRSPLYDSRRESHRWNDKSGSVLSDRICRDFAAGGCRRGTQCRFLHPDGGDDHSENDASDRRKSRPEPGRAARYGEESEDDNSRSKSRSSNVPCKNLLKGKCIYGAGCYYSHHIASSESSVAKGVGSASFDLDRQHQGSEGGKPMCKYFLAGKCNRDNCWFSHDESAAGDQEKRPRDEGLGHKSRNGDQERRPHDEGKGRSSSVKAREWNGDQERRSHDEGGGRSSSVKSREWKGPTWDQALTKSDTAKVSRWSDPVDANASTASAGLSERMDNKWGPEGRTRGSPERKEKASEKSSFHSNQEWNEDDGRDLGAIKSLIAGNSSDIQEFAPISPGLESAKLVDISTSLHARATSKEDPGQLIHVETVNADDLKELRSSMKPDYMSRESPIQNGVGDFSRSLVSGDDLFGSRPSNGQCFDFSGSGQVLPASLNVQSHHERHLMETAKTQETQEFGSHQSFFNGPSNGHVAQYFSNPTAASSVQKFINEQAQAHMQASLNPSTNSARMVAPLQPTMPNPMGDLRGLNNDQNSGFSFEPKSHIPFEQFSPMSGDVIEPDDTFDSPKSKLQETPGIPELMQHKILAEVKEQKPPVISEQKEQQAPAVLDVTHKAIKPSAEFGKGKKDVPKEGEEARSKEENNSGNKDDKDMRLFKNALVESVKEILKPTWKLGKMSRDVHKSIVKKVVDKVTGTFQADHIPKTQDKIDQYLSHAKAKIAKLVQAYVDRHNKTE